MDRIAELLLKLGEFTGLITEADGIRWKHDSDGKFSVRRLYKREVMTHSGGIHGPWEQIWKGNTPTKVKGLHLVGHQKGMSHSGKTQEKRLPDCLQMFFCHEKEETNSHLFLHCRVTVQVWCMVYGLQHFSRALGDARTYC